MKRSDQVGNGTIKARLGTAIIMSLCVVAFAVSWRVSISYEKNQMTEVLVYFGLLLVVCAVMLIVVIIHWSHHRSILTSSAQSFCVSAAAALPLFKGQQDLIPLIGPAIFALFGGGVASIVVGLRARRIHAWHVLGVGGILSAIGCLISCLNLIREVNLPVPSYDHFLFSQMALNDSARRIEEAGVLTIVLLVVAVILILLARWQKARAKAKI